jgi:hypothetical protein
MPLGWGGRGRKIAHGLKDTRPRLPGRPIALCLPGRPMALCDGSL